MEVIQNSRNFLQYMQAVDAPTKSRRAKNKLHFEEQIWILKDNWIFISYEEVLEKYPQALVDAKELSTKMAEEKPKEFAYKEDGKNLETRLATGNDSEAVMAYEVGVPYNKKAGSSVEFKGLDLVSVVGIKSSEYGHCAMVEREPTGPQIIMIKDFRKPKYVNKGFYVCGLATVAMQLKYETIHRLTYTDAYYKAGKPKTGFYGYKKLIPITRDQLTLPKLKKLVRQHEDRRWWMWLKENQPEED